MTTLLQLGVSRFLKIEGLKFICVIQTYRISLFLRRLFAKHHFFFLFCFKWAMVIMMMITLFTSQTSSLAQVLKLIGETYYAASILINFWFMNNFPIKR